MGLAMTYRCRRLGLEGNVIFTGQIREQDKAPLYSASTVYMFPSLYEGFGLPPVEALALSCPVIASRLPAVQEACGDAVLYTSPDDPAELARLLERITADAALRASLRERGRTRTEELTWRATAARLIEEISPWLM